MLPRINTTSCPGRARSARPYRQYIYRALILWGAATAAQALAAAAQNPQAPVLFVGQQQLAPYVHSPQGRALLALPGQDVVFVRGSIHPYQIGMHRPSYVNAILI